MSCTCTGAILENVEEVNRLILSHTPLREIVSQIPGTSRSALGRHRKHVGGLLVRAVARIVSPPPDSREIERYENNIYAQSIRLITEKRGLYETQLAAGDFRGASQTHQQLVDYIRWQHGLLPSNEAEPGVEVRFVFDSPETQRRADEIARATAQRVAVTDTTTEGPTSAIPEVDVVSPPNVEHEAHRVEETVATSAKAPVSGPAPADSSPFRMRPPTEVFSPGGRR